VGLCAGRDAGGGELTAEGLVGQAARVIASYMEDVHGPTIVALQMAGEQGRRAELRAALLALYSAANTATGGTLAFAQEYLLATAAAHAGG
jgi:hypothetical protein